MSLNSFQPIMVQNTFFRKYFDLKIITEKEKFFYFNISKKLKNDVYFIKDLLNIYTQ